MKVKVPVTGFAHQKIEINLPGFFRGARLWVNDQPPAPGGRRGTHLLKNDNGQEMTAYFRNTAFGLDVPQLVVGSQVIDILPPLKWYHWAWAVLPFLMVSFGGISGGLIGIIAAWLNIRLLRQPWHWLARLAATGGVTILSVIIWFLVVLALYGEL